MVSKDGYILTNAHVVSESGQAVSTVTVIFKGSGSQGTQVQGTVVGADESTDVALIKVDPSQAPTLVPIPLGDSSRSPSASRSWPSAIRSGLDFSLSSGVVSATNRDLQSPNGATITRRHPDRRRHQPRQLRRPLIDANGQVIGINEQIDSQSGGNEGIGFAVPINTAVQVMEQIKSGTLPQPAQTADPYGYGVDGQPVLSPDCRRTASRSCGADARSRAVGAGGCLRRRRSRPQQSGPRRGLVLRCERHDWYHHLSAWRPLVTAPALRGTRASARTG